MKSSSSSSSLASSSSSSLFKSLPHSPSFLLWFSTMDDLIGTESGVFISSSENIITVGLEKTGPRNCRRRNWNQWCNMKKEYPPVIPLLAQTGNLRGHMPWVLSRHYTDGRLILKAESVKHHDYFEAHRINSRLILNLIPLDNTIRCPDQAVYVKNEKPEQEDIHLIAEHQETDGIVEEGKKKDVQTESDADGYNNNVKDSHRS